MTKVRERIPSPAMIVACLALTIALSSAGYAAVTLPRNSVGTAQLKRFAVTAKKIKPGNVTRGKIAANAITSGKVLNGSLLSGDFAPNAFANAIDSDEVVDFGLSNADVGVLFAQVNANGTIANSSGGVTGGNLSPGFYEVDFGRDISSCAFVMTQGQAGVGSSEGAITGASDRTGNVEAVFASTSNDAGTYANHAFQLVVVC